MPNELLSSGDTDNLCRTWPQPSDRVAGLEWLRALMTVGVLAFHAAIPYFLIPLPGLCWSVHERGGSAFVDACGWALNGFIMPVFFLLSGFCSAGIFAKRGARVFLDHRTRRLLPTMLFGAIVILPVTGYVWFAGWIAQGLMPLHTLWRWGIPNDLERDLYGAGHLWFLQTLWIFCVSVWLVHQVHRRLRFRGLPGWRRLRNRVMSWSAMPLLFAIPGAVVLALEPRVVIGFRQAFVPDWFNLAYYVPCFAAGFWLQRSQRHGASLSQHCEFRLLSAAVLFAALLPRVHAHLASDSTGWDRWGLAACFSAYAWLATTGLFGVCIKYFNRPIPAVVRLVSSASLWVYLIHVPVVGLLHVALLNVPLPIPIKFLLAVGGGLSLSLISHWGLARSTWVERLLEPTSRPKIIELPPAAPGHVDRVIPSVSP